MPSGFFGNKRRGKRMSEIPITSMHARAQTAMRSGNDAISKLGEDIKLLLAEVKRRGDMLAGSPGGVSRKGTVVVELPERMVKDWARDKYVPDVLKGCGLERACRDALEARKSPYEKFKDEVTSGSQVNSAFWTPDRMMRGAGTVGPKTAHLMAAAPRLLDALIDFRRSWLDETMPPCAAAADAIEHALPEDVAKSVLVKEKP